MASRTTDLPFPTELLRKYNQPGPRYTSYPTALHFQDNPDPKPLLLDIAPLHEVPRPISLYVHLPFCESNCWFCGCTKVITRDPGAADRYLDALAQEIELLRPYMPENSSVRQFHLGGGTPTFLSATQLRRLHTLLQSAFSIQADCEGSVEIDPRYLELGQVDALREMGCNRASLGVQDHNPRVQEAIHRIQPFDQTSRAVEWLRAAGFQSINLDLIYGLPRQTPESFARTVEDIIPLRPDRIALFSYAHVPWIKPQQKIFDRRTPLPDPETKLTLLRQTTAQLLRTGYCYIGMDHFALPEDELTRAQRNGTLQRNFQGYSTCGGTQICALGMSAISQTERTYRQNEKDLQAYYRRLERGELPLARGIILSRDDRIRRHVIMELMCHSRLQFPALSRQLGIDFADYFQKEFRALRPLETDGLLQMEEDRLTVTPEGRFLIRNIAMHFDVTLPRENAHFSKTI